MKKKTNVSNITKLILTEIQYESPYCYSRKLIIRTSWEPDKVITLYATSGDELKLYEMLHVDAFVS